MKLWSDISRGGLHVVALTAAFVLCACASQGSESTSGSAPTVSTGAAATNQAEANVRVAVTAIDAYYQDHDTYVGMSVSKLRAYDAGLKLDPIDSALLGKNRFCVQSTVRGRVASENWPPLSNGEIADKPCS